METGPLFFFYRAKEEGGGDKSALNRGNSVGRSRFLAPFLFIISFVAPFHSPPRPPRSGHVRPTREILPRAAPRNCEILLHPCPVPSPLPSAHSRDNKLARLGSARKPRFCLAMDRNEHLWREAKRGGNVYANCNLGISPEMRPFLFLSRFWGTRVRLSSVKESTRKFLR